MSRLHGLAPAEAPDPAAYGCLEAREGRQDEGGKEGDMKPGPRPKPRALRLLHGSHLPDNSAEPQPLPELMKPRWLKGRAAKFWDRLVPELKRLGLATRLDANALGRYVDMLVRWLDARTWLDKHGDTYEVKHEDGSTRYVAQYPQVAIYRNLNNALLKIEVEYGMTASARVRLVAPKPEQAKDEFKAYLSKKPKVR